MTLAVRPAELREVSWVKDAIATRRGSKAAQVALSLADQRLYYQSTAQYSWQLKLEAIMEDLRQKGVTAMDLLVRVVQVYAILQAKPYRFKSERAEKVALARAVIYMRPQPTRPAGRILYSFGDMLANDFAIFSWALFKRLEQEAQQRSDMLKTMSDFTPITEITP